jgi:hypothetical protein
MKHLFLASLIAAFFLTSCGTAQFHINKAEKHTAKAISKGAIFTDSTDTLIVNNTTHDTTTVNDTVFVRSIETIVKTVTESGEIRYISRADKRREHRLEKQNKRLEKKNKRLEARLTYKNERSKDKTKRVAVRNNRKKIFGWKNLLIIALLIITIYLWTTKR